MTTVDAALSAADRNEFHAAAAQSVGNATLYEKTLVGWFALRGNVAACSVCLDAGLSPNAINGSLPPLMVALAAGCGYTILRELVAAGATMAYCDQEMADEYIRLMTATRDPRLIKMLTTACTVPRPTVYHDLQYIYVLDCHRDMAMTADVNFALLEVASLTVGTFDWWQSIHAGQAARIHMFLQKSTLIIIGIEMI